MSKNRVPAMAGPKRPGAKRPQAPTTRRTPRSRPSLGGNRLLLLALAAAGVIAAVLIGVSLLGGKEETSTPASTPGELPAIKAAGLAAFKGIPQNGLVLGNPSAKATLVEYGDLQCPACATFAQASLPTLVQTWVRSGKVKLEFRGMDFLGDDSTRALRFVHAAAAQDKGWSAVELLYANQGTENQGWVTDDLLRATARVLGLDAEQMVAAASGTAYDDEIARGDRQAKADNVSATPSFIVEAPGGGSTLIQGAQPPEAFTAALEAATTG